MQRVQVLTGHRRGSVVAGRSRSVASADDCNVLVHLRWTCRPAGDVRRSAVVERRH